ncbi:MAG: BatA domain-containing protein, partial [Fidelibacterota bacterium]
MTFLSPGILWGLFAASIPILIHLISQRNTREV